MIKISTDSPLYTMNQHELETAIKELLDHIRAIQTELARRAVSNLGDTPRYPRYGFKQGGMLYGFDNLDLAQEAIKQAFPDEVPEDLYYRIERIYI